MAKLIPKQTEQEAKDGWSSAHLVEEVFNKIKETPFGDRYITELEAVDDVITALLEMGYLEREK